MLVLVLAVFFLQMAFSAHLNFFRIQPDFLLIAVIFLSFYVRFSQALLIAFCSGFLKDSFTAGVFGSNIFSFLLITVLLEQYKRYVYREDLYLKVVLVFLACLINGLINYLVILSQFSASFFSSLFFIILPEGIYTTLFAPAIFWLMRRCVLKYSI